MGSLESRGWCKLCERRFLSRNCGRHRCRPFYPQAFVEGIMEGKEWVWDNGILKEVEIAGIKDEINEGVRRKQSNVSALHLQNSCQNF